MREKLKVLDLFSGIGGFSLGLERTGGFETVAFCEIDPFCRKVLKKHWPNVPICHDIKTMEAYGNPEVPGSGFIRSGSFDWGNRGKILGEPAINVGRSSAQDEDARQIGCAAAQGTECSSDETGCGSETLSSASGKNYSQTNAASEGAGSCLPNVRRPRNGFRSHSSGGEGRTNNTRKSATPLSSLSPPEITIREKGGLYGSLTDIGPIDVVCGGFP